MKKIDSFWFHVYLSAQNKPVHQKQGPRIFLPISFVHKSSEDALQIPITFVNIS